MSRNVLAFDIGVSGGQAVLGCFSDGRIVLRKVYSFGNRPIRLGDTVYWDIMTLFGHIKRGIRAAADSGGFESIGIDTWGVDFAFIGKSGNYIEAPVHYSDKRTKDIFSYAFEKVPRDEFYDITGNRLLETNTVFQIMSVMRDRPKLFASAEKILTVSDLLNYMLSGTGCTDRSSASTTQMMDIHRFHWAYNLTEKIGIPRRLLPEIVPCGKVLGNVKPEICSETGITSAKTIAVCGHDVQCSAAAVPAEEDEFMFLIAGTWALFGIVSGVPLVSELSCRMNITNEVGLGEKITSYKSLVGLWLINETLRQWRKEDFDIDFSAMAALAAEAKPFGCFIDPNSSEFLSPGNIPEKIRGFCRRTGQKVPCSRSEIARCIFESLALSFRFCYDEFRACTRRIYKRIYIVGKGCRLEMLCAMTADACGCEVISGPAEAVSYGNSAIQLLALGEISSVRDTVSVIGASENIRVCRPVCTSAWNDAYSVFRKIRGK